MRTLLLASCVAVALLSGCAGVSITESAGIERVLANPARSASDRDRSSASANERRTSTWGGSLRPTSASGWTAKPRSGRSCRPSQRSRWATMGVS